MAENLLITRMTSDDIDDVVLLDRSIFYDPWARTSFSGSLKKDTSFDLLHHVSADAAFRVLCLCRIVKGTANKN